MQKHYFDKQEIIQATDECVMCGLCLPHCPTYSAAQIEPESPRGRIALVRALYEEKITADKTLHTHLSHCVNCMSCQDACPANVDYEKIINAGRNKTITQTTFINSIQQAFIFLILSNTAIRKLLKSIISTINQSAWLKVFSKLRLVQLLPNKQQQFYSLDHSANTGPKVTIIESCANDLVSDPAASAAAAILTKLNCKIIQQNKVYCCGALHQRCGEQKTFQRLREKFINAHKKNNIDYLAAVASGCGAQIKHYEKEIDGEVIDINELLLTQLKNIDLAFKPFNKKVFIHQPCTQSQLTTTATLIEHLLSFIPEIELIHFSDKISCCGAGGMNSITQTQMANTLLDNKINELQGAENALLVSTNIGCAMHFQARLKQENISIQVCHPVTLLAQQML